MSTAPSILRLAVPTPLKRHFDYLFPEGESPRYLPAGVRVQVPFNGKVLVGILCEVAASSEVATEKLKAALAILDDQPIIHPALAQLIAFASKYYQHPIGETYSVALPTLVRRGQPLLALQEKEWQLLEAAPSMSKGAVQQKAVVDYLQRHRKFSAGEMKTQNLNLQAVKTLEKKGVIQQIVQTKTQQPIKFHSSDYKLDAQQKACVDNFHQLPAGYQPILLEGITGSGKTEVYLSLVESVLKRGQQVLVLVPEIGLTPQTLDRFRYRFDCDMAIFHSNLSDKQKLKYWQYAQAGIAPIVIGTRSAVFTPCDNLGLIIVDEEHDLSYKQQDTLRYSARDLACVRGQIHGIPVVLGSATPSLETLHNAEAGKFHHWVMTKRAGSAEPAVVSIYDIKQQMMVEGMAEPLLDEVRETLRKDEQVLLFINRRGFAPALVCHDCGWVHQCHACDAKLTVHRSQGRSICHHCGAYERTPTQCPECRSVAIEMQGTGTERLALHMQSQFPQTPCYRIDRDTTKGKGAMESMMMALQGEKSAILIGTQMLAKGHHLPNVTLVIIVDADAGLMGTDFRAVERFGQLITQVTGRSGRGEKRGRAIIQTHYPEHEQLLKLVHFGYRRFAMDILAERKTLGLPPFSYLALVRLEAQDQGAALRILQQLVEQADTRYGRLLGPFAAGLARRAHYYRFQVLVYAPSRQNQQYLVRQLHENSKALIKARHRFSIDIDPQDMA